MREKINPNDFHSFSAHILVNRCSHRTTYMVLYFQASVKSIIHSRTPEQLKLVPNNRFSYFQNLFCGRLFVLRPVHIHLSSDEFVRINRYIGTYILFFDVLDAPTIQHHHYRSHRRPPPSLSTSHVGHRSFTISIASIHIGRVRFSRHSRLYTIILFLGVICHLWPAVCVRNKIHK